MQWNKSKKSVDAVFVNNNGSPINVYSPISGENSNNKLRLNDAVPTEFDSGQ